MANTEIKVTIKDKFNEVIAMVDENATLSDGTRVVDFLADRAAKFVKKSSGKASKNQVENEGIKDIILEVLTNLGTEVTVSTLIKSDERLGELSSSKITSLLTQLKNEGRVVNRKDKKSSLYSV